MVLSDPLLNMAFQDYGVMLPIAPDRASRVLEFLGPGIGAMDRGGPTGGFPGPVLNMTGALHVLGMTEPVIKRRDLERIHQGEFVAALYGDGEAPGREERRAAVLLNAYELIDEQGRPHRYEPERAIKPLGALFDTILSQVEGTYLACRLALKDPADPFCYYLGGGMHHARYDSGSGFCVVNDIMVSAGKILADGLARLVWVIDVDAHKGDGTAELVYMARMKGNLGGSTGMDILTLSVHMARGWPLDEESLARARPGRAPLVSSDIDIAVESGEEAAYAPRLEQGLVKLEARSGAKPDLAIVVDGADPYEHDGLPSSALLALTLKQCLERDRLIYNFLRERSIPSAWIMAGGYGERAWEPAAYFLGDQ
jgi:acetoin utilization deacetylase AcuC-like enzyme